MCYYALIFRFRRSFFRGVSACSKNLARDRSAAIAMQFALLLLLIMVLSGGSIDIANVYWARQQLQNAADTAAVSSVTVNSPASVAAAAMLGDGEISAGKTDALNLFNANIQNLTGIDSLVANATVAKSGLNINSQVSFTANIKLSFLPLVGMTDWTVTGASQGASNLAPYIDFYMLLDNTPSMGIAATQAGINQMVALTQYNASYPASLNTYINSGNTQCAFACHDLSASPNDFYALAATYNIPKRIDVVRLATQNLTSTAQSSEVSANEFRMAIYTFGSSAQSIGLTQIAQLSSNLSSVSTQANAIDVMSVPYNGYNNDQMTDFDGVLSSINTVITAPGDGSNPNAPKKVLFMVTDGVADAYYPATCSQSVLGAGRCQEPINVADCTAIKNRGIQIAVLYTTYYPLTTNGWYNGTVAPWASQIPVNMQQCASPGLYFEVSPTDGIQQAMTALFVQVLQNVRLAK